jgi:hypothetical protein
VWTAFGSESAACPHIRHRLNSKLSQLMSLHSAMKSFWKSSIFVHYAILAFGSTNGLLYIDSHCAGLKDATVLLPL